MNQATRHRSWLVGAVLVLALTTGACSGDDDGKKNGGSAPSGSSASREVATSVHIARLTGRLPVAKRRTLTAAVQKTIDGWWDAAYLGDYPRTSFSWPGFTRGARAQAQHDAALTSNKPVGSTIDGVTPKRRDVRLDVLAVKRRPVGVTARIALRFATTGDDPQDVAVRGQVYLTPTKSGWRVFGYDLTKGSR